MPDLNEDDLASLELVLEWSAHRTFMSIYNAVFEDLIASGWDMPTDPSLPLSKRISVGFAIQQASGANYGDLSSWEVAMARFDECLESYCKDQDDLAEWLQHRRALLKGYLFTVLLKHLGIDYDHKPKSLGQMRVPSSFNASKYRSEITRAVRDLGPKRSLSQDAFMVDRMEKRFLSVVSEGQVSTENTFEIIVENTFLQSDFPNLQIFLRKITDPLPRVDIGPSAASLSSSFAAANSSFAAARPKSAAKDIASLPARGDVRAAVENFNRNAAKNDPLPSVTGNKRNSSSFAARHGADDDDDDDDEEEDTGRAHKQPAAKASKITNPTSKGQKVKSIDDDEAEEDEVVGFGDDGDDGFADSDDDAPPRGKSNVEALALKRKQAAATKPLPSKLPSSSSGSAAGGGGKVAKAKASKTATKPAAADANTTTLSNNGRRPRVAWSMDEEDAIKQGARDYGRWQDHRDKGASERVYVMDWKRVLDENKGVFDAQRRSNDLKDKWKNMFTKDRSLARPDDGSSPTRKASPAPKPKAKAKQQQKKSGGKKSSAKKRIVESTDEEEEDNGGEEEEEGEEEED